MTVLFCFVFLGLYQWSLIGSYHFFLHTPQRWELLNWFSAFHKFAHFQYHRNTSHLLNIAVIFDKWRCSLPSVAPENMTLFCRFSLYFSKIPFFRYEEINGRSFSNPHRWTDSAGSMSMLCILTYVLMVLLCSDLVELYQQILVGFLWFVSPHPSGLLRQQSNNYPCASEVVLRDMGKMDKYLMAKILQSANNVANI